ncbi:MAG: hypothetical protein RBS43_02950 [Candidatus Cloacimonas sp.]|jgi:hypothetical protein|nr:hypothetical protein [Candidatus Cloacimonas sp.]
MDSFKKLIPWLMLIPLSIILLSGCTRKNNLTGNNWSDTYAQTVKDSTGIIMGYSYPADTLRTITGSESKLLVGNYQAATAISYMRFAGLPASAEISDLETPDSCFISIQVLKRSALPREPLMLQLYKINKAWTDTLSQISETDLELIPGAAYTVHDSISIIGRAVKIPLPTTAIYDWESEQDSTGWNLAIKAVNSGWVEISSAETTNGSTMQIKYKKEGDTTFKTYSSKALKDSYTLDAPLAVGSVAWKLSNISPSRMFVKFDPNYTLFKNTDGSALSAQELKRLTVNKATMILYVKNNEYYNGASTYSIYPFNVVRDSISSITPLIKADYEILLYTPTSIGLVRGDSLEIDITPLVQAYTSGDKTAKGVVLQSMQERQNFGELEFWDCLSGTPDSKKPFVRITYTPPFIN